MNLRQLCFVALIVLVSLALGVLMFLALQSNVIDATVAEQNARECVSEMIGNCIIR